MKTKPACSRILFITLLFFCSCKKETKIDLQAPMPENSKTVGVEEAYPGIQGETFKVLYNNKPIYVVKKLDRYVWLGDIAFDKSTFDSLKALEQTKAQQRTFKNDGAHLWPLGIVYYTIAAGFSNAELTMVNDAIQHWRNNTALTFTQRTTQQNYIRIQPGNTGSGLYSDYVGMKGGQQIINLETGGFLTGHIIHEIGHAIGFYHEQSRTDRNNAINVIYDNVFPHDAQHIYQFQTFSEQGQPGAQIGNFDFGSIMLYSSFDFSDGIHPTLTRLDGSTFFAQRNGLSAGDIETAAYIYGPPYARFEYVNITSNNYWDGSNDYQYSEDEVYLRLYSDPQCTTPYTTTIDRTFSVVYIESGTMSNGQWPTFLTVPTGSTQLLVNSNLVTKDYYAANGDVQYEEWRRYEGRGPNVRF